MVNPADLAYEAGWRAGYQRGTTRPHSDLSAGDAALTADWRAWKRETAQPERCGCCGTMIVQGALCGACRTSV